MDENKNSPEVSVIIPVYNGAAFVPGVISNLNAQSYRNFEAVFVNDGSRDDTAEVLKRCLNGDQSFPCTVIHQENAGVSAARNAGMQTARGKYLCFMDADDTVSEDYLQVLHDALEQTGARVAVAHITRDQADLKDHGDVQPKLHSSESFLREFLYRGSKYSICACMIERNCLLEHGLKFPVGYRYSEDVYLLWQLFAHEDTVAETPCKIYFYFDNPKSAMNSGIDIRRMDAIKLMRKLDEIIPRLRPGFGTEFNQYVTARHHWSILWQAATMLGDYKSFREYCGHFEMKKELKKLLRYPETRISLSSVLYVVSPWLYYHLLRLYVRIKK